MATAYFEFESLTNGISDRQRFELFASYDRNAAAVNIFYPLELSCFGIFMSMVLRRVVLHLSHGYYNEARGSYSRVFDLRDCIGEYAMSRVLHILIAILLALTASGFIARLVAAVFRLKSAYFHDQAALECDSQGSLTNASMVEEAQSIEFAVMARTFYSVQAICEAAALLTLISAYLLFFPACIVMFRRVKIKLAKLIQETQHRPDSGIVLLPFEFSEPSMQTEISAGEARQFMQALSSASAQQQRHFMFALTVGLAGCIVRATLAILVCYAYIVPPLKNSSCGDCDSCQSDRWLVNQWFTRSPEVFIIVTSLSSTLPQIISFWLMVTKEDRFWLVRRRNPIDNLSPRECKLLMEKHRMGINFE
jgi:hypothetical protein